jgi:hypothetical protein
MGLTQNGVGLGKDSSMKRVHGLDVTCSKSPRRTQCRGVEGQTGTEHGVLHALLGTWGQIATELGSPPCLAF